MTTEEKLKQSSTRKPTVYQELIETESFNDDSTHHYDGVFDFVLQHNDN